jgi:hypothetical protein
MAYIPISKERGFTPLFDKNITPSSFSHTHTYIIVFILANWY